MMMLLLLNKILWICDLHRVPEVGLTTLFFEASVVEIQSQTWYCTCTVVQCSAVQYSKITSIVNTYPATASATKSGSDQTRCRSGEDKQPQLARRKKQLGQ